ncbi:MAG: DUF4384 domain-containing protein [Chloroflexia bacterium]|nr:DUF4384 domain-containing protein [Chloroflexia bacterium]
MKEQEFEQVMEHWADRERTAAPDMRPTSKMYRMVRARGERRALPRLDSLWARAGVALAGLLVLITSTVLLYPAAPGLPVVAVRQEMASGQQVVMRGATVPPQKGPSRGPLAFRQFILQIQRPKAEFIEGIDLRIDQEEVFTLTSADNYRLLIEPAGDCYLYVFQINAAGSLVQLFPHELYSEAANPLQGGKVYRLPPENRWFYLGEVTGTERLYVIAAGDPLLDLQDLYAQYEQAKRALQKRSERDKLLQELESLLHSPPAGVVGRQFSFSHR